MKLREALQKIVTIGIQDEALPVEWTIAEELKQNFCPKANIVPSEIPVKSPVGNTLCIAVMEKHQISSFSKKPFLFPEKNEWVYFTLNSGHRGLLASSKPYFLYALFSYITENFMDVDVGEVKDWFRSMSFFKEKSTFDLFLTQYARLLRGFDREKYIREYARLGFTHIEVNGLAFPHPAEQGISGEFYPEFYTYCPALDQFVSSRLNQGIYDQGYLQANLDLLKENVFLAKRYGLTPGLLCFEPRSVPEELFERYPTLRGARVDHPFRSFKPRYSLALAHPVVRHHYQELITKLLEEVPELEYLTIWTNDSGAGFEHTKSLYVGRNGGAYLVREWKSDSEVAKVAAQNVSDFFHLLKTAASRINPCFRVITRLESFYGEREFLWPQLKEGIDVESNSLLSEGWESTYGHPLYSDIPVLGSALHSGISEKEVKPLQELLSRDSSCFFYHFFCSHGNHEPLLGIPFPWLVFEKLKSFADLKIPFLAHVGGIQPPDKVPYAVNQEVYREFQFDSGLDIDFTVNKIAEYYVGRDFVGQLVKGWRQMDSAIRSFVPLSIYTHYGVVWQRLLVRPLVPDIDRIPNEDRAYYEEFMCTSIHNPNKIDLSRDVLFHLITKEYAQKALRIIEDNVWEPLFLALQIFKESSQEAKSKGEESAFLVFEDQLFRAKALRCLFVNLRNMVLWISTVQEYLKTTDGEKREALRERMDEMMDSEIENCLSLIDLWDQSAIEWMIVSGQGETPFIYGDNFPDLLQKKIVLMEKYRDFEPFIDPEYMYRISENPYVSEDKA